MKKYLKFIILACLLILLTVLYFSFPVVITYDGSNYVNYLDILNGSQSFANWDRIRGIVFPFIIYVSTIFGKNNKSLLIISYVFFIIALYSIYLIIKSLVSNDKSIYIKYYMIVISLLLIILNPIIFGYYHALLTEYVAMTFSVISCLLAYYFLTKSHSYLYGLILAINVVICWHLKQPYAVVSFVPLLFASVLRIIKNYQFKNIMYSLSFILLSIFLLFGSFKIWNYFVRDSSINADLKHTSDGLMGNSLISSMKRLKVIKIICEKDLEQIRFLSDNEKDEIKDNLKKYNNDFRVINVLNSKDEVIDQIYIETGSYGAVNTINALLIMSNITFKHPLVITNSLIDNYLTMSNFYQIDDIRVLNIKRNYKFGYCLENCDIGFRAYEKYYNTYFLKDEMHDRVKEYEVYQDKINYFQALYKFISPISVLLYTYLFLLLPFLLISVIIIRIKYKHSIMANQMDLTIILLGYSFSHLLINCFINAIIDRYCLPAYITNLIGVIAFIYLFII